LWIRIQEPAHCPLPRAKEIKEKQISLKFFHFFKEKVRNIAIVYLKLIFILKTSKILSQKLLLWIPELDPHWIRTQ
jgi:hypothetical protein